MPPSKEKKPLYIPANALILLDVDKTLIYDEPQKDTQMNQTLVDFLPPGRAEFLTAMDAGTLQTTNMRKMMASGPISRRDIVRTLGHKKVDITKKTTSLDVVYTQHHHNKYQELVALAKSNPDEFKKHTQNDAAIHQFFEQGANQSSDASVKKPAGAIYDEVFDPIYDVIGEDGNEAYQDDPSTIAAAALCKHLQKVYVQTYMDSDTDYKAATEKAESNLKGDLLKLRLQEDSGTGPIYFFDDKQMYLDSVKKAAEEIGREVRCFLVDRNNPSHITKYKHSPQEELNDEIDELHDGIAALQRSSQQLQADNAHLAGVDKDYVNDLSEAMDAFATELAQAHPAAEYRQVVAAVQQERQDLTDPTKPIPPAYEAAQRTHHEAEERLFAALELEHGCEFDGHQQKAVRVAFRKLISELAKNDEPIKQNAAWDAFLKTDGILQDEEIKKAIIKTLQGELIYSEPIDSFKDAYKEAIDKGVTETQKARVDRALAAAVERDHTETKRYTPAISELSKYIQTRSADENKFKGGSRPRWCGSIPKGEKLIAAAKAGKLMAMKAQGIENPDIEFTAKDIRALSQAGSKLRKAFKDSLPPDMKRLSIKKAITALGGKLTSKTSHNPKASRTKQNEASLKSPLLKK